MLTMASRQRCMSTAQAIGVVLMWSSAALAQAPTDHRVAVTVSAGQRTTSTSFSQSITFEAFSEQGSLAANYKVRHPPFVDGGVTVRVWRGLAAGISVSYLDDSYPARVTALIPHPILVNQPRTISGDAVVTHRESTAHLQAVYWLQRGRRLDVLLSGGPSVIRVDQDFVSDVSYAQTFPYNTATYKGATVTRQGRTALGINVGAEAGWRLAGPFGVAGLARYSRAVNHFASIGAESVVVGGLNVGGGVRLRF
jgi:hypothetical protein